MNLKLTIKIGIKSTQKAIMKCLDKIARQPTTHQKLLCIRTTALSILPI